MLRKKKGQDVEKESVLEMESVREKSRIHGEIVCVCVKKNSRGQRERESVC